MWHGRHSLIRSSACSRAAFFWRSITFTTCALLPLLADSTCCHWTEFRARSACERMQMVRGDVFQCATTTTENIMQKTTEDSQSQLTSSTKWQKCELQITLPLPFTFLNPSIVVDLWNPNEKWDIRLLIYRTIFHRNIPVIWFNCNAMRTKRLQHLKLLNHEILRLNENRESNFLSFFRTQSFSHTHPSYRPS